MTAGAAERWTENRATGGARVLRLSELWDYRELVYFLAVRDLKSRYKQAFFGIGWAVVQPAAAVATFTIVFGRLANVPSEGVAYPVFALVGFLVWSYFAGSLTTASDSLVANASLVTKVYFPRLAAPLAALMPGLVHLLVGLLLLGVLMVVTGTPPDVRAPLFPLVLLWTMLVALGPGLLFATLNVRYRDVGSVFGLVTQLWLLASPVAYPTSLVPEAWRWAYALNPMVGPVDAARWVLLGTPLAVPEVLISAGVGVLLLLAGLAYFQRTEREFADVI